jgi:hypothetical protein
MAARRFDYSYSGIRGNNLPRPMPQTLLRDAIDPTDPPSYVSFVVERGLDNLYRERAALLRSMSPAPVDSPVMTNHRRGGS